MNFRGHNTESTTSEGVKVILKEVFKICFYYSLILLFLFCPGTAEDLVDTFFEVEVEMEKDVCRDLVCTSPKDEEGFLFHLTF